MPSLRLRSTQVFTSAVSSGSPRGMANASGTLITSGAGTTTAQGAIDGIGKILLNAGTAVANGPLSFTLGAQLPQLELGMGTKGLNVAGHVTLVGQTGIATYGSGCDTRKYQVIGSTGATGSFFGMSANLFSKNLFDKSYYASYPYGCGVFPGRDQSRSSSLAAPLMR